MDVEVFVFVKLEFEMRRTGSDERRPILSPRSRCFVTYVPHVVPKYHDGDTVSSSTPSSSSFYSLGPGPGRGADGERSSCQPVHGARRPRPSRPGRVGRWGRSRHCMARPGHPT
jgi:hypothetical protein